MRKLQSQSRFGHYSIAVALFVACPAIAAMLYFFLRMAIDAPWHPHRCNSGNSIHRFHGAVTFLTREAGFNVALMRKVHIVGKVMYFDPRYRFTIFPVGRQLQNLGTLADARYELVTSHAFGNAGYAGYRGLVSVDVTVLARN